MDGRSILEYFDQRIAAEIRLPEAIDRKLLSPFQYFQLLASVMVGFVLFGEVPDLFTWLGAAVIVGSGLYIGWTQTRPGGR